MLSDADQASAASGLVAPTDAIAGHTYTEKNHIGFHSGPHDLAT
jgi:hypothetical protein